MHYRLFDGYLLSDYLCFLGYYWFVSGISVLPIAILTINTH